MKILKLNKDLIRLLLLDLESQESNSSFGSKEIEEFSERNNVLVDETLYVIARLIEAGYIVGDIKYASDQPYFYYISTITYQGHEFLDSIRDPKIWTDTKKAASTFGSVSLDILSQIATNLISKNLGL